MQLQLFGAPFWWSLTGDLLLCENRSTFFSFDEAVEHAQALVDAEWEARFRAFVFDMDTSDDVPSIPKIDVCFNSLDGTFTNALTVMPTRRV